MPYHIEYETVAKKLNRCGRASRNVYCFLLCLEYISYEDVWNAKQR